MTIYAKLAVAIVAILGTTGYMAYLGASSSYQYYVLVDECASQGRTLAGRRLRVSGRVAADSLHVAADRQRASFELAGKRHQLSVTCRGPIPDNLAEEMEVVVEGSLDGAGVLRGDKVLTRCASKYEGNDGSAPKGRS